MKKNFRNKEMEEIRKSLKEIKQGKVYSIKKVARKFGIILRENGRILDS